MAMIDVWPEERLKYKGPMPTVKESLSKIERDYGWKLIRYDDKTYNMEGSAAFLGVKLPAFCAVDLQTIREWAFYGPSTISSYVHRDRRVRR